MDTNRMGTRGRLGYLFITPYFVVFLLLMLYPIFFTLYLSFQQWNGMSAMQFIGFRNYARLFQDEFFWKAFVNTIIIWTFNFIPQLFFALYLAVVLSDSRVRGKKVFRAIYYLPNLVTAASIGVLFKVLLDWQNGSINHLLLALNLVDEPINFLVNGAITKGTVSFICWWQWFGYTMIIIMAGLKAIPDELYEAARVDGASRIQEFFQITLPLLRPTMLYVMITSLIGGFQIFDVPMTLTNGRGAPDNAILTMVMYLYNQAFKNYNTGYGSAVAYGLFLLILLFSLLMYRFINRKSDAV